MASASFALSPGVQVTETDLSQIIAAVATSSAALVGFSRKGRSFQRVKVTSDKDFVGLFGNPNAADGFLHYAALGYLAEGNDLTATRVHNGAKFAGAIVADDVDTTLERWADLVGTQNERGTLTSFAKTLSKTPIAPASTTVFAKIAVAVNNDATGVVSVAVPPTSSYSGSGIAGLPVVPGTVQLFVAVSSTNTHTFTDPAGDGILTDGQGGSGTFDYVSGAWAVTMTEASTVAGQPIRASYKHTGSGSAISARANAYGSFQDRASNPQMRGSVSHSTGEMTVEFLPVSVSNEDTLHNTVVGQLTYQSRRDSLKVPIIPGSLVITVNYDSPGTNLETFSDNGDGSLTGDRGGSGAINYLTGAWSLTLGVNSILVFAGGDILASYDYQVYPAPNSTVRALYAYTPKFKSVVNRGVFLFVGNGSKTSESYILKGPVKATTDAGSPTVRVYRSGQRVGGSGIPSGTDMDITGSEMAAASPSQNRVDLSASNPSLNVAFSTAPATNELIWIEWEAEGVSDTNAIDFTDFADPILALFGDNEGVWADTGSSGGVRIRVANVQEAAGTFDLQVYQRQNGSLVKKATYTVSRKDIRDGNGRQLYVEKRLNDLNNLIRATNNDAVADTVLPYHTVQGESLADGDGVSNDFTCRASQAPIQPGSVAISAKVGAGTETVTDGAANGRLVDGSGNLRGTVNYETGEINDLRFSAAPTAPAFVLNEDLGITTTASAGPYAGTLDNFPVKPGTVNLMIVELGLVHTAETTVSTSNGTNPTFTGTVSNPDVVPGTVHLVVPTSGSTNEVFTDPDRDGVLVGSNGGVGTINYGPGVGAGDWSVTVSGTVSDAPLPITVTYRTRTSFYADRLIDDGAGNLWEGSITDPTKTKVGTVDYATGAIAFTLSSSPSAGKSVLANYTWRTISANYFTSIDVDLDGGDDGSAITSGNLIDGWDLYSDPEQVDIRMLLNAGYVSVAVQQKMVDICTSRKDCISVLDIDPTAFDTQLSPTESAQLAIQWRRLTQNFNTNYSATYAGYLRIYDKYNDKEVIIPPSGHMGGIFARNDRLGEPWTAPAGFRRATLDVLGVTHAYGQTDRDNLYQAQINPIRVFPGQGIVVWGQKTEQVSASALDRINVRRLLIVLEKAISIFLENTVFEPNDVFTRGKVTDGITDYLTNVKARRGLYDFQVVCDTSNNTPSVIDANGLEVDVYLKPVKAGEFINLNMILTTTGASFQELIQQAA